MRWPGRAGARLAAKMRHTINGHPFVIDLAAFLADTGKSYGRA
jgi:hypothetical protein